LSRIRLGLALIVFALGGGLGAAAPAHADLRVCNKTTDPVSVAMGYRADKGWESEGWWVAQPSQCATVFQGNLNSPFYYLFAADDIREVYAEAKGNGFDVKVLRQIVRIRKQDHNERMEQEALLDLYMAALGMQAAPREDELE
jgi:uncharacterized membrane protein